MAAKKRRGETEFTADGVTYKLCMTLGAMDEIETIFELASITDLSEVFANNKVKVGQLIGLLGALIRGGGHDISDETVRGFDLTAVEAFAAAMDAINAQGGDDTSKKPKAKTKKKEKKKGTR